MITQSTNAICRKQHRHQALVSRNVSLIQIVGNTAIMKHGKAAVNI